jgi:PAS domain S-box-containing protein
LANSHPAAGTSERASLFVGRREAAQQLLEALEPVLAGRESRAVLVLAPTGGGKTAFVEHCIPELTARGATIAQAKCNQFVRHIPYASLCEALQTWLVHAAIQTPAEFERVRQALQQRLGTSARVLAPLLPNLILFLGNLPPAAAIDPQMEPQHFRFAIQALLRAMTDHGRACLLFLDDLQWADEKTLELVAHIGLDPELPRVGFLLTHRTEEDASLARATGILLPLSTCHPPRLTRLLLPNLSFSEISILLEFATRVAPNPETAHTLLARTGGNPLFLKEILRTQILPPTPTPLTGNGKISIVLRQHLQQLPLDQQDILGVAALLGPHIQTDTLAAVLPREEGIVRACLQYAVQEGVLQEETPPHPGRNAYHFRHDQWQQAARELLPAGEQARLHAQIGHHLSTLVLAGDHAQAFGAAYHLQLGATRPLSEDERRHIAHIYLICARRARLAGASQAAYEYALQGCTTLGDPGWEFSYEDCINLHTEAARAAFATGAREEFARLAQCVREHARTFLDALPMQEVLVMAHTSTGDVPGAFDLVCAGASRLGLTIPAEPDAGDILMAEEMIRQALDVITPSWISETAPAENPAAVGLLRILGLGNAAAYTARPHLLRILLARELHISARHGFSHVTALALAYLAALDCAAPETLPRGIQLRAAALAATHRVTDGATLARTRDILHGMTATWNAPLREAVAPLLENAHLALENGAFDCAGYSALKGCFFALLSGTPLHEISTLLTDWRRTLGEYGQQLAHDYLTRALQAVELLTGSSAGAEPAPRPTPPPPDWSAYEARDDHYGALYLAVERLLLAVILARPEMAAEAAERLARHAKGGPGLPHLVFGHYYAAIASWDAAYAGLTPRSEALRQLSEAMLCMAPHGDLIPATFAHKHGLLRALHTDLLGSTGESLDAFEQAWSGAWANGYPHEAGLAAERAVRTCTRLGRPHLAEVWRQRASEAWSAWGRHDSAARPPAPPLPAATDITPSPREAEALIAATDELHAIENLLELVPRWLGARRSWLLRVDDTIEVIASTEQGRIATHLTAPLPLTSVPELDPLQVARAATLASRHEHPPAPAPEGGILLIPLAFQLRTHGILALEFPPGEISPANWTATTFACAHVAALMDSTRFQYSLSRQARQREQTEDALHQKESLLQHILDTTRAVIFVKQANGHYLLINRVFAELFGVSDQNLAAKTDFDIFPAAIAETLRRNDQEVLQTQQPIQRLEEVVVQGKPRTYLTVKAPLFNEVGTPYAVCGIATDITQQQETEEALRDRNLFIASLLRAIPLPVFFKDREGRYLGCNDAFTECMGVTSEEIAGKTVQELWPGELAAVYHQKDLELMRTRQHQTYEFQVKNKHGAIIPVIYAKDVFLDGHGQVAGLIGAFLDISQRKQTEAALHASEHRLRQAEKLSAIGLLAGGIAHDFNNQLGGIMGAADLLNTQLTDARLRQFVSRILQSAERAASLTQQLLAFARKGNVLSVPVNLHAMIHETVTLLERSIDKRITIRLELAAPRHHILGDPAQLQNAILNLALNARDAMPEGGQIRITTTLVTRTEPDPEQDLAAGCHLQIDVADTGSGMNEETTRRLFEPFFTTKGLGKGTGLGLASVHGTIKSHHGAISVDSKPNQGTTFHILLPLHTELLVAAAPAPAATPAPISGTGRILIVDDEPVLRHIMEAMLVKLGYTVTACADGEEALALYRQEWQTIDLVILDMVMPRRNGRETFLAMRAVNPAVRALLASGFTLTAEAQGVLNEGILGFIQKPFTLTPLSQQVATALQREP